MFTFLFFVLFTLLCFLLVCVSVLVFQSRICCVLVFFCFFYHSAFFFCFFTSSYVILLRTLGRSLLLLLLTYFFLLRLSSLPYFTFFFFFFFFFFLRYLLTLFLFPAPGNPGWVGSAYSQSVQYIRACARSIHPPPPGVLDRGCIVLAIDPSILLGPRACYTMFPCYVYLDPTGLPTYLLTLTLQKSPLHIFTSLSLLLILVPFFFFFFLFYVGFSLGFLLFFFFFFFVHTDFFL